MKHLYYIKESEDLQDKFEHAIYANDIELVRKMLTSPELDINMHSDTDTSSNQYISIAAGEGFLEIVKLLMSHPELDMYDDTTTPLMAAVYANKPEVVKYLLDETEMDPAVYNNDLLDHATRMRHNEIVDMLLDDTRVLDSLNFDSIIVASGHHVIKAMIKKFNFINNLEDINTFLLMR